MRTGEFPRKKGDEAKSSECKGLIQPETRKSAQLKQKSCKAKSEGFRVVIEKASLVQLVERRSPKPDVEGSSPSGRDLYKQRKRKRKKGKEI